MSTVSPMSPPARRLGLPTWFDTRLLIGVTLVLLSVAGGARLISGARHTSAVVAITRNLEAGTWLSAADIEIVRAQLPRDARAQYLTDPSDAIGKRLGRALSAGELVPLGALRVPEPATTVVIPLPPDAAPTLAAGQRVVLWLSTPSCSSRLLLDDVTVQSVHENRSATFAAAGGQTLVVSLPPDRAERVIAALAIDDVVLRGARLDGSIAAAELPDLAPCRSATAS
jgi:hypothetical protein